MLLKIKKIAGSRFRAIILVMIFSFAILISVAHDASAARFQNRGMYINSARASDTTHYIISFQYTTVASVGSLLLEFCDTPIPALPCNAPPGMDVSGGVLAAQTGETGFTISAQSTNQIVLSRTAAVTGPALSSYRFNNMVNPNGDGSSSPELEGEKTNFYVRLTSYASTNASGSLIDFGSVASTITPEQEIYTQVPPILIFCVAGIINDEECADTSINFVDFGELKSTQTAYTSSQMLARTNAQYGYSITVAGKTMTSGIRSIPALATPTANFVGTGQFGLNLAVNTDPAIGAAPTGPGTNAVIEPNYDIPDKFLFNNGDLVVTSNGVTHTRKFTVSYIVNVPSNQAPGVYSTTITYICTGGF